MNSWAERPTWGPSVVVGLVLLLSSPASLAAPTWRVLEAKRTSLRAGAALPVGTRVRVPLAARLHVMRAEELLISAKGAVELEFGDAKRPGRVTIFAFQSPGGAVQVATSIPGDVRLPGQRRLRVLPGGATVVITGQIVLVRRGRCVVESSSGKKLVVAVGQRHVLGTAGAGLSAQALARLNRYGAPPPWTSRQSKTLRADLKRVKRWTAARQQAAREMASCGCTEGSGPGQAGNQQGGGVGGVLMLEGRNATLRVRVKGLPRKGGQ